jgi:hypothetical protein
MHLRSFVQPPSQAMADLRGAPHPVDSGYGYTSTWLKGLTRDLDPDVVQRGNPFDGT